VDIAGRFDDPSRGDICDVAGIRVGHHQRTAGKWRTGTTVVFAPDGAVAAVDVRGGAPGSRETDALQPGRLVQRIHAICLTGGSAFGLRAADGCMDELASRGLGHPVGNGAVVPVVPAAVIFDLGRGGDVTCHPTADFGRRALRSARRRPAHGSIGAGTGAVAGGLAGGVGTASTTVTVGESSYRVGALMVVNAHGSAIDPDRAMPWASHHLARRPSAEERRALTAHLDQVMAERAAALATPNTTIGVVATDAPLDRVSAGRMATVSHDGLARALSPVHLSVDGDIVFAMSTAADTDPILDHRGVDAIATAAAATTAAAIADAMLWATGRPGCPSLVDLCPSVRREP